jgi:hypothetical protein
MHICIHRSYAKIFFSPFAWWIVAYINIDEFPSQVWMCAWCVYGKKAHTSTSIPFSADHWRNAFMFSLMSLSSWDAIHTHVVHASNRNDFRRAIWILPPQLILGSENLIIIGVISWWKVRENQVLNRLLDARLSCPWDWLAAAGAHTRSLFLVCSLL